MRKKLPFHCQCGQHLWLQDLLPTVGALWDPSERPLLTEEKKREGKTHFSQEKREVGESGKFLVFLPGDLSAWTGLHAVYGQMLGGGCAIL